MIAVSRIWSQFKPDGAFRARNSRRHGVFCIFLAPVVVADLVPAMIGPREGQLSQMVT